MQKSDGYELPPGAPGQPLSRRQLLWLMAVAGGGVVTGCAVNPVTGEHQLMLMTPAQEVNLDRQQSPHQFSADFGPSQDQALNDYIASVGAQIASTSHRPDMPYNFRAVNANYINAYAFPGGSIAVTRGILLDLPSEAALAALLGHEVAHVTSRHTAQRMTKHTLTGLVLAGAGAVVAARSGDDRAALVMGLGGIATGALLARYSRDDERQADALGMEYMVKTQHNPQGMVELMDLLRRQSAHHPNLIEQMFSSHPMSDERYRNMTARLHSRYADQRHLSDGRTRYLDQTARLRRLKPAIERQQEAEAALRREKYAEAEELLKTSLKLAPDDYTGLVLMGKTLMIQERMKEAQRFLDKAMAVYPQEAQAQHLGGVAALHQGKAEIALTRFQRYEQLLPGNPNTLFFIGMSHETLGQRSDAASAYQRFLQTGVQGQQADLARQKLQQWGI